MIIAIDPGRDKCGIVLVDFNGDIKLQQIITTAALTDFITELSKTYIIELIIIGNGTTSNEAQKKIKAVLPDVQLKVVDERNTTEDARKLYWQKNPPKGWRRLLPTSMQVPPKPVDDIVAEILALRYLKFN